MAVRTEMEGAEVLREASNAPFGYMTSPDELCAMARRISKPSMADMRAEEGGLVFVGKSPDVGSIA